MASIDKIYGSTAQYDEFHAWVKRHNKPLLKQFYDRDGYTDDDDRPIANFTHAADIWLYWNCPLQWVTNRIIEQYGGPPEEDEE